MKATKILVLERLDKAEEILSAYISQNFPDAKVNFMSGVDKRSSEEIIAAVQACDIIVAQSIFAVEYEGLEAIKSFLSMIDMFVKYPKIRRPAHIIHSTHKLIPFLNFDLPKTYRVELQEMLKQGLEVVNVHYHEYEGQIEPGVQYFKARTIKVFDPVKLWYNEPKGWIYDEHLHYFQDTTVNLFKKQAYFLENAPKENLVSKLSNHDIHILKEWLSEEYHRTTEIIEDLEEGHGYIPEESEKKSLLKIHKDRLKVLDKMGIESFR